MMQEDVFNKIENRLFYFCGIFERGGEGSFFVVGTRRGNSRPGPFRHSPAPGTIQQQPETLDSLGSAKTGGNVLSTLYEHILTISGRTRT